MPYDFNPEYSTNSIWRNEDMGRCLTADLDNMDAILSSLQSGKANATHTHDEYAEVNHTHDGYAEADHTHSQYALATDVSDLEDKVGDTTVASQISTAIASKADANHSHTEYAEVDHIHSGYAASEHSHTGYALENHEHTGYAATSHSHSEYANADHTHTDYAASTHTHTEYAASNHAHSYNDLSDLPTIPTALPANGGNADTVDGKHASEFALATDVAALQTLVGDTGVAEQISTAVASKANVAHAHAIADITNLSTELDSKYEKPSTGISKTDLASDVQASLGKADTAVQSLSGYATESYVDTKVAGLVDTAPEALNTLNELAAALGDDPNFAATVATQIGGKVDKVTGKELSSNDYTDVEKTKLAGIETGANKTVVDSALSSTSTNPVQNKVINAAISNLNTLVGDTAVSTQISNAIANKANTNHTHSAATTSAAGFMSASDKSKLNGIAAGANAYTLPAATSSALGGVKVGNNITNSSGTISLTKANVTSALGYTPPTTNTTYSAATTSASGLMSAADKVKLDGIATGANKITVDSALSSSSTNPVQNKVVNSAISNLNTLFTKLSNPNLLINGDFQVWQRGQSFSNIANCYAADRWLIKNAKANTSSVAKSTDVPSGQPMTQSIKLVETSEENSYLRYCFDSAIKGTYTVSFWYKTSAAFNSFIYDNGSWVHLGKLTTLNSWQKATFTFTATSATYLSVIHAMSIGTTYITGVKLEYGSIATPFIPRLYVEELAMCQRYFFRLQSAYPFTMTQRASANTYSLMSIPLPVPLRGQPTIKFSNVSLLKNGTDGTSVSVTGVTCAGYSQIGVTLRMVIGSNYEAGTPYFLALPNSGYIDFDAEIY